MTTVNQPVTTGRINTLEDKFSYELGAIYDAEHHFLEAQQQMVQQATNDQLKSIQTVEQCLPQLLQQMMLVTELAR